MVAESNVGARVFIIGKDAALAGVKEITAAVAAMNKEIAAGGAASKAAAAGTDDEAAALARLNVVADLYRKNLATVNAEQDAVATLGKAAFLGLAAAGAAFGYESIKWAQNYQTQLVRLRTQAGLTVSAMNAIGKAAKANAAGLGTTPPGYLEAAYHPASAGFSTRETIAITNAAAKLAAIGGSPLEDTTNALTGVMKSYNLGSSQTNKTAATLNAIVGAGNMHFADLNNALASGVAASGKTFGVSLPALGGALAFMTDRGVPANQAGTHLRMTLALLGAPSGEANKLLTAAGMSSTAATDSSNSMSQTLQAAGVTTTQLSSALRDNSGAGGIYNALAVLHSHLAGSGLSPEMQSAMISRSFGGGRMGTTVEMMYNSLGGLAQKTKQIDRNGSVKKLMQDWNAETKTFDFQLKKLGGTVETLGTTFGTKLLPPLTDGVKALTDVIGFMDRNKDVAYALGTVITAVLVPAIGVYLKRALLSSSGAIMTVLKGYRNLITGQSAEDIALARTEGALGTESVALAQNDTALSANDTALSANAAAARADSESRATAGAGGLASTLGLAGLGVMAGAQGAAWINSQTANAFANQKVPTLKSALALQNKIAALKKQIASNHGGLVNDVDNWGPAAEFGKVLTALHVPGLQNNAPGTIAKDEAQLKDYQRELSALTKTDPAALRPIKQQPINVYVTIDGKQVTKAVTKYVKRTAALSS